MMNRPPLPNEGILWHRNRENGYYRKREASVTKDTVLVLKPMSVTTRLFSSGVMQLDIANSLVQVVPAPRLDKPGDEGSPQQRVFQKNKTRQCYFRIVHKGTAVELKARDNVERDRWVKFLLSLKDRNQKPDETFPFGVPPRDAEEHTVTTPQSPTASTTGSPGRGGPGGEGDPSSSAFSGGNASGGAPSTILANSPGATSTAANANAVEGVDMVESDGDDDATIGGESFATDPRSRGRSGGPGASADGELDAADVMSTSGTNPAAPSTEPDPNVWHVAEPSSDVNIAPKILIDPPSDQSTPMLSPRTTRRRRNKERFEDAINEEGHGHPPHRRRGPDSPPVAIEDLRAETRGFVSRLSEMVTFGTIQLPPRQQQFIDSVFASSVLEEGSHLGSNGHPQFAASTIGGGERGSATFHGAVNDAVRDGLHLQLIPPKSGGPSATMLQQRPPTPTTGGDVPAHHHHNNRCGCDEDVALDARIAFEEKAAVVTTSSLDTIVHIPYTTLESLKPRRVRRSDNENDDASGAASGEAPLSRLEVFYWWRPIVAPTNDHHHLQHKSDATSTAVAAGGVVAAEPALLPSSQELQRVVLGFASALDLKVCLRVLMEKHQLLVTSADAAAGSDRGGVLDAHSVSQEEDADEDEEEDAEAENETQRSGGTADDEHDGDGNNSNNSKKNSSRDGDDDLDELSAAAAASAAASDDNDGSSSHHSEHPVLSWWHQRHKVGARRSLLLHEPPANRFFAASAAAAEQSTHHQQQEGSKSATEDASSTPGGAAAAAQQQHQHLQQQRQRSVFRLAPDERESLQCHQRFALREHEDLLKHAYLDNLCHKNVQHFLAASKGFY